MIQDVGLLYKEADEFRRDAYNKWKQALEGQVTIPGVSQDYLLSKTRLLREIAFAIEDYAMWIQGKPLEMNLDEVKAYRQLIKMIQETMP
jgi:hypothetical protein